MISAMRYIHFLLSMLACGTLAAAEEECTYYLDFGIKPGSSEVNRNSISVDELEIIGVYRSHTIGGLVDNKGKKSTITATFNSNSSDSPSDIDFAANPIAWTNTNAPLNGINTSSAISDQFSFVQFSNLDLSDIYTVSILFNPQTQNAAKSSTNFYASTNTGSLLSASYYQNTPAGTAIDLPITASTSAGASAGASFSSDSGWVLATFTLTKAEDFLFAFDSHHTIAGVTMQATASIPEPATVGLGVLGMTLFFRRRRISATQS